MFLFGEFYHLFARPFLFWNFSLRLFEHLNNSPFFLGSLILHIIFFECLYHLNILLVYYLKNYQKCWNDYLLIMLRKKRCENYYLNFLLWKQILLCFYEWLMFRLNWDGLFCDLLMKAFYEFC